MDGRCSFLIYSCYSILRGEKRTLRRRWGLQWGTAAGRLCVSIVHALYTNALFQKKEKP